MISCCSAKCHYCYGVKIGNTHQNKNCIYPLTQKSWFWKFSLTLLVSLCSSHKQLWNLSGSQPKHVIIACMRAAGQLLLCLETPHSWTSAKISPALRIMFLMQEQKLKGLSGNTADFKSLLEISTRLLLSTFNWTKKSRD